ncbi:DUF58 domain-containing protein [Propionicicella superfundia]|uniref:DUF58 domain-containing protein n=1 Tax=Propionicicella superfundia TaxID=348582 RepID=UPI00042979FF|nr:DUF58 domain-containing protein [Propionicicella superfundia]
MANPWTLLSGRGKALLVSAAVLGVGAIASGQRDLLLAAVLLLALPALALASVLAGRPRLSATRPVTTVQVPQGQRFTTRIDLTRSGGFMLCDLLVEETVPDAFDGRVRFAVTDLRGRWQRQIRYDLVAARRGRFRLGPLVADAVDPFGLARSRRVLPGTTEVLVPPRITPLTELSRGTAAGLVGLVSRMGHVGSDDVMVREYRTGDDVRRIHWRSSARAQALMVRREEQARDLSVTLLVDTRARAHTGPEAEGTFEWTVATAASIALHCVDEGFALTQVTADGRLCADSRPLTGASILTTYAELAESPASGPPGRDAGAGPGSGLLIALTGRLSPADAAALVDAAGARAGAAIVCTQDRDEGTVAAATALREGGWTVVEADPATDVGSAWLHLLRAGGNA